MTSVIRSILGLRVPQPSAQTPVHNRHCSPSTNFPPNLATLAMCPMKYFHLTHSRLLDPLSSHRIPSPVAFRNTHWLKLVSQSTGWFLKPKLGMQFEISISMCSVIKLVKWRNVLGKHVFRRVLSFNAFHVMGKHVFRRWCLQPNILGSFSDLVAL